MMADMTQSYRLVGGPLDGTIVTDLPLHYFDRGMGSAPVGPGGDIPRTAQYRRSLKAEYAEQVGEEEAFDHGEGYRRS